MDYEWDDAKAAENRAKHGIDFIDAIAALIDSHRIEDIDDRFAYGEERIRTIGMANGSVLFVVSTMRDENLCRIVSARRAKRYEQDRYHTNSH